MRFVDPQWLVLLGAVPFLAMLAWWAERVRRARRERFAEPPTWVRLARESSGARRTWGALLPLLAIALLVVALARPQSGTRKTKVEQSGAAIAIALDSSLSMATEDVAPSRFHLARVAIERLTRRLAGDRVALISFSKGAYLLSPLTSDYRAVDLMLDAVEPGAVGQGGSSVGAGVFGALESLAQVEEGVGRLIVVISDGEDLEGQVERAASAAAAHGVPVVALGVGTSEGNPIPVRAPGGELIGYKQDRYGKPVLSRLNEAPLRKLAEETGGEYWKLDPSLSAVEAVVREVERLEREVFDEERLYSFTERYAWLVLPALLLLWIETLLPAAARPPRAKPAAPETLKRVRHASAGALAFLLLTGFDYQTYRETQKGVGAYSRENYEESSRHFTGAIEEADEEAKNAARLRYNLGTGYYKEERYEDAIAEFERAAKLSEDPVLRSRALYNMGNATLARSAKESGQERPDPEAIKQALELYRASLREDPQNAAARHNFEVAHRLLQMPPPPPQDARSRQGEGEQSEQQQQAAKGRQGEQQQEGEEQQARAGAAEQQPEGEQERRAKAAEPQDQGDDRQDQQGQEPREGLADRTREDDASQEQGARREGQTSASGDRKGEPGDRQARAVAEGSTEKGISREEAERILDALAERERELRREQREQLQQVRGDNDW